MIIEDDRDVRESIVEVLQDAAYFPLGAANGKEALGQLRARADMPCVILLDLAMPVIDGWEFRALQRLDPELDTIPVVILSARPNVQEVADGMAAAACLKKPVQLDALLATVQRFCKARDDDALVVTRASTDPVAAHKQGS
jgi:CheY-like chemotaxis protein